MTKTRKNAEGLIDLSGQVFGRLTVIEEDIEKRTYKENGSIQYRRWVCKCECGTIKTINHSSLSKNGGTQSCGCLRRQPYKRVIGDKYQHLTVIAEAGHKISKTGRKRRFVKCLCDCGNETVKELALIRSAKTKDCGCGIGTPKEDFTGIKFGNLTVLGDAKPYISSRGDAVRMLSCLCDCGNSKDIRLYSLKGGNTKSCGCLRKERIHDRLKNKDNYGKTHTRLYSIWNGMIHRCNNPKSPSYENYGARGITVCEKWNTFGGFMDSIPDGYEDHLTLDRINNDGNYEPDNCRWATYKEQSSNKRPMKNQSKYGVGVLRIKDRYFRAQWQDAQNKSKFKLFKIEEYGEELAHLLACEFRQHQLDLINLVS